MYIHNLEPVIFKLHFFELRWYSLAYILGIIIGWWLGKKILNFKSNNEKISFDTKNFDDLISYIIISIILGGRIGYILFYNFKYYVSNPLDVFKIWEGGMSFHGALLGIVLGTFLFAKRKKISTFFLLDIIAVVAPIGIFFGRVANFINGELYGKASNLYWSVIFPKVDNIPRHPSQLYEAFLEGIVLFLILVIVIFNKNYKTGVCSSVFLILYGVFRIFSEQFREPDLQIGYLFNFLSMGSVLSIFMVVIGLAILFKINYEKN